MVNLRTAEKSSGHRGTHPQIVWWSKASGFLWLFMEFHLVFSKQFCNIWTLPKQFIQFPPPQHSSDSEVWWLLLYGFHVKSGKFTLKSIQGFIKQNENKGKNFIIQNSKIKIWLRIVQSVVPWVLKLNSVSEHGSTARDFPGRDITLGQEIAKHTCISIHSHSRKRAWYPEILCTKREVKNERHVLW